MPDTGLIVKHLGLMDYTEVWQAMSRFTEERDDSTPDELWLVEHPPVFTQGRAGKPEHLLNPGEIPVVQTDRGGQVTYHGPGQLVAYPLLKLKRYELSVRDLVSLLENITVELLNSYGIDSYARPDAPGVYLRWGEAGSLFEHAKIASLGLRIRKGYSFHGLSINVAMDLSPFDKINPCGYAGMPMTQIADRMENPPTLSEVAEKLVELLSIKLCVN